MRVGVGSLYHNEAFPVLLPSSDGNLKGTLSTNTYRHRQVDTDRVIALGSLSILTVRILALESMGSIYVLDATFRMVNPFGFAVRCAIFLPRLFRAESYVEIYHRKE